MDRKEKRKIRRNLMKYNMCEYNLACEELEKLT